MQEFFAFAADAWPLFVALALIVVMLVHHEVSARTQGFRDVPPEEATRLINRDEAAVLDVRDSKELSADGRIAGSVHIPVSELGGRVGELEKFKERPVLAYCRSGHRSRTAARLLRKQGFEQVYNLQGGIVAWQNANLPVTRKKK